MPHSTTHSTTHSATQTDVLFEPIRLGSTALANRLALAPMTRVSAEEDGRASERMARYYQRFARGGFSLLITEGVYIDTEYSQGYLYQPGLVSEDHVAAWTEVITGIHQEGGRIFAQLMHAGSQSQGNRHLSTTLGPSAIAPRGTQLSFYRGEGPYAVPRAATKADLQAVRRGFVHSARQAVKAGFDGVELHGANGYLLDEFLTDYLNDRDDEYGGDARGRVRLAVETCDDVLQAVGSDITVGIRISQAKVSDNDHRWAGALEDAQTVFSALGGTGIHFLHTTEYRALRAAFGEDGPTLAALARQHSGVPVIANGMLDDPADAVRLLSEGAADIAALGKAALTHPDWPHRVRAGDLELRDLPAGYLGPIADIKDEELIS